MKKVLLFTSLLFSVLSVAQAQDFIITHANDTIQGKIVKVTNDVIVISTGSHNQVVNLVDMKQYQINTADSTSKTNAPASKFRIAVTGGYSNRTISIDDHADSGVESYYKSLRRGFALGADFNYFFNRYLGIGLDYGISFYNTDQAIYWIFQNAGYWKVTEKTIIQHIMPTVNVRAPYKKNANNYFLATLGVGYSRYNHKYFEADHDTHFGTEKGGAFAFLGRVGYDIGIGKNFAIVLQATAIGGKLSKVTMTDEISYMSEKFDLKGDERIGLGRFELSVGFRFGK